MRRKTTSEFIKDSKKIHGDKYDYSLVEYIGARTKVKIICPQHGEFEQRPGAHFNGGRGCKQCGFNIRQRLTTEQFIERARKLHGDKYDYSLVQYVNNRTKVKIICPKHGEFEQKPDDHQTGYGCNSCAITKRSFNKTLTTEEFIEKSKQVHGDKYDYSLVDYVNNRTKVKIICPKHGEFEQVPSSHCNGNGCKKCNKGGWRFSDWYELAQKSKRFDSFKIYFIKCYDENEVFYKIGTTYNKIDIRFVPSSLPYQYEIINVKEIKDINDREGARMIYDMENRFKRFHKSHRHIPKKEFGGMFECFSSDGPLEPRWNSKSYIQDIQY